MASNINLRKFTPEKSCVLSIFLVIGRKLSGKTILERDIANKLCIKSNICVPRGTIISSNIPDAVNDFNIIPEITHHGIYNPEILEEYAKNQGKLVSSKQKEEKLTGNSNINPISLLLIDEASSDVFKNMYIRLLLMNNRTYKTCMILGMQYPLGIPPALRSNMDYIFIFGNDNIDYLHRIYSQYAGMFADFETFHRIIDEYTHNYQCLVIDNTSKSNKIEDIVFWYKAEL